MGDYYGDDFDYGSDDSDEDNGVDYFGDGDGWVDEDDGSAPPQYGNNTAVNVPFQGGNTHAYNIQQQGYVAPQQPSYVTPQQQQVYVDPQPQTFNTPQPSYIQSQHQQGINTPQPVLNVPQPVTKSDITRTGRSDGSKFVIEKMAWETDNCYNSRLAVTKKLILTGKYTNVDAVVIAVALFKKIKYNISYTAQLDAEIQTAIQDISM